MNGIIIDGTVYEAVPSAGYCNCDGCDLTEVCDAHAHDICNDCSKIFDTYIDDPCWHFRYSQELTDELKKIERRKPQLSTLSEEQREAIREEYEAWSIFLDTRDEMPA